MSRHPKQKNIPAIWEHVAHPHAQKLLSEAIWLILNDRADRQKDGPFDSKPHGELNKEASVESKNHNNN